MAKLPDLLKTSPEYALLHPNEAKLYQHMSVLFSSKQEYMTMNHYELAHRFQGTEPTLWQTFLSLTAVEHWIKNQLAFNAQVAFRKAQKSLVEAAQNGSVSAAKQVTELSGLFDHERSNKQVVLTYVPRPVYKSEESSNEQIHHEPDEPLDHMLEPLQLPSENIQSDDSES